MRSYARTVLVAGAGIALAFAGLAPAAGASSPRVFVSPTGTSGRPDVSCTTAAYSDINEAVAAAPSGGTVVVCAGSYKTSVTVDKPLTLVGHDANINAAGQSPPIVGLPGSVGIVVEGTHDVTVEGLSVRYAGFDGILVGRSTHVLVQDNYLADNGDVGVDLNGSWWSTAERNVSVHNAGGGFLLADDLGSDAYNTVERNVADLNQGGCGVIVAGHSTAGVWGNTVADNVLRGNGTAASPGAGVVIATAVPHETVADNTVIGNTISGNGISGVTLHAHLPTIHMSGNRILDNDIATNNVYGDPVGLVPGFLNVPDMATTGILVGSASPLSVEISGNLVHDDHYGVFVEGLVRAKVAGNTYQRIDIDVARRR